MDMGWTIEVLRVDYSKSVIKVFDNICEISDRMKFSDGLINVWCIFSLRKSMFQSFNIIFK